MHQQHTSVTTQRAQMTTRVGHCPHMVVEQVSDPLNGTRLLRSPRNKTSVTVSQQTESSAPTVPWMERRIRTSCTRMSTRTSSCSPHCFQGSSWTARGWREDKAWRDHRLHPERVLREQEALHRHRCTRAQRFHSEHGHWRVADRHESHPGPSRQPNHLDAYTRNSSPSSCRVHTKRGNC